MLAWIASGCTTVEQQQQGGARRSQFETLVAPHRQKAAELAGQGRLREAGNEWKIALTIDPKDPISLEESKKTEDRIQQAVADRLARGEDALKRGVHLEA